MLLGLVLLTVCCCVVCLAFCLLNPDKAAPFRRRAFGTTAIDGPVVRLKEEDLGAAASSSAYHTPPHGSSSSQQLTSPATDQVLVASVQRELDELHGMRGRRDGEDDELPRVDSAAAARAREMRV